jgi:hypothetical protein
MADNKDLTRIAALLRKAESTDNEHEADAYLQAAQRLATLSAVDLAVARAHSEHRDRRVRPTQRTVTIGESGKRGLRTYVQLFLAIGRANNLTCDIARDSSRVYAYGFDTDIDTVQALYASLVVQMVRASDAYIKSGDYAREKVTKQVKIPGSERYNRWRREVSCDYELVERPVHATTARINFQQAFAARIGARLTEAREQVERDATRTTGVSDRGDVDSVRNGTDGASVALVLREREIELAEHYRANSTARGSWTGTRATSGYSARSQQAGDQAGRRARLGAERSIGGTRPEIAGGS